MSYKYYDGAKTRNRQKEHVETLHDPICVFLRESNIYDKSVFHNEELLKRDTSPIKSGGSLMRFEILQIRIWPTLCILTLLFFNNC